MTEYQSEIDRAMLNVAQHRGSVVHDAFMALLKRVELEALFAMREAEEQRDMLEWKGFSRHLADLIEDLERGFAPAEDNG